MYLLYVFYCVRKDLYCNFFLFLIMKINLVVVGKLKPEFVVCVNDYEKRLPKYCNFNIFHIKEKSSLNQEANFIVPKLKGFIIALAQEGSQFSSKSLAELIKNKEEITFIIGSHLGLAEKIKSKANLLLSLSKMTLPHQIARLMLSEQIYRAFSIINKKKYHK